MLKYSHKKHRYLCFSSLYLSIQAVIYCQESIKKYGDKWWVGLEKDNPKLMNKLSFYDQLVSTVGRGFVCAKCLDKDNTNWIKYRKNEKITQ